MPQYREKNLLLLIVVIAASVVGAAPAYAAEQLPDGRASVEFFEKEVRPLLVEHCLSCHGGAKNSKGQVVVKGKLDLTSRDRLLKGGDSGPAAVPGDAGKSLLLQAVRYELDSPRMPPKGKLSDRQVATLTRWVREGLAFPEANASGAETIAGSFRITEAQRQWWAFQPLASVALPETKDATWPRGGIDRFILAELERRGMNPAKPADRRTLIRRATFDLTGLPPTVEEMDAFLKDESPQAFEKVVDRLLASPAYGERWARHWLDVVRYTDYHAPEPTAHGSADKFELFEAWRYRDWVVGAFNRDLPYDQFIRHQIAGDRLSSPNGEAVYPDGLIASTFLAIGTWDNGDADKDKVVSDIVDDQIEVVGKAFLGLTLSCARCHDHKFDPISNEDYYALAGIFYSTRILANVGGKGDHTVALRVPLVPPSYLAQREGQQKRLVELNKSIGSSAGSIIRPALLFPHAVPTALVYVASNPVADNRKELAANLRERKALQAEMLPPPPLALAAQEGGTPGSLFTGIQDVPLHIRGSYTRLGPVVKRRLPQFLAGDNQPPIASGSGRLELARWIASKDNPLTARVIVNRIWQHHFGEGIVRTPNNFGKLGEAPSHPQLLDWLAQQFVEDGWSLKKLHRRIMLSATYQQSSVASSDQLRLDPDNRWLGRMNVRRLEAEAIRDAMLVASGQLDPRLGGPAKGDLNLPRRSLYIQTVRQDRGNFSTLFDAANPEQSVEKRTVSTVAPQALFLLNSPFVRTQAEHLARRLREEVKGDDGQRIDLAYRWLYGRPASVEEVRIGGEFLNGSRETKTAWNDYIRVLLCGNEFVYID
jgi:hypothetical protein